MLSKDIAIGWVSSAVEAYNMAIYSFLAPLIAMIIFQEQAGWSSVFFSYSLVLIGSCFLYPAGAFYYGLIGDKKGRQQTCIYSTLGLAIATGLMAFVPVASYSWVCFLLLISAQNFFSGGEYYGSIVFSLEHSGKQKNGLVSALSCLFAVFGLAAANGFAAIAGLYESHFVIKLCFLAGGIGGIISYILKNYCNETPDFEKNKLLDDSEINILVFLQQEWKKLSCMVAVFAFFTVSYFFIFIFLPLIPFADSSSGLDTFLSLIAYGVFLVFAGFLADFFSSESVMKAGMAFFAAAVIPLCMFCKELSTIQLILTFFASLTIGPIHGWMLNQFPVKKRCRGIFISSSIATAVFSGSTVPVCLLIYEVSSSLVYCGLYPLVIGLVAIQCMNQLHSKKEVLA